MKLKNKIITGVIAATSLAAIPISIAFSATSCGSGEGTQNATPEEIAGDAENSPVSAKKNLLPAPDDKKISGASYDLDSAFYSGYCFTKSDFNYRVIENPKTKLGFKNQPKYALEIYGVASPNVNLMAMADNNATGLVSYTDSVSGKSLSLPLGRIADNAFSYAKLPEDVELSIYIPDSVCEIGNSAFSNIKSTIKSLHVGRSVSTIGSSAFLNIKCNQKLILPYVLTQLGPSAFQGTQFVGQLAIPPKLGVISSNAFESCKGLVSLNFSLCESLSDIQNSAFANCTSLTGKLKLPLQQLNQIRENAFKNCESYKHQIVKIPEDCQVGPGQWKTLDFRNLIKGLIPNKKYHPGETFNKNGFIYRVIKNDLYDPDDVQPQDGLELLGMSDPSIARLNNLADDFKSGIVSYEEPSKGKIALPVLKIKEGAFESKTIVQDSGNPVYIEIPDSVISIGDRAFSNITNNVYGLTLGKRVEMIGNNAFYAMRCTSPLILSQELTTIGDSAFANSKFSSVLTMPDYVETIKPNAFLNCNGLTKIDFNNGLKTIGENAFKGCTGLACRLILPTTLLDVGAAAFSGCITYENQVVRIQKTTVVGPDQAPQLHFSPIMDGVTENAKWALGDEFSTYGLRYRVVNNPRFYKNADNDDYKEPEFGLSIVTWDTVKLRNLDHLADDDKTGIVSCQEESALAAKGPLSLPLVSIGANAFKDGTIRESNSINIVIPDSVFNIEPNAFNGLTNNISSIKFGSSLNSIQDSAFANTKIPTSITFPDSLASIGTNAFYKSTLQGDLTIPNSVKTIGTSAFAYSNISKLNIGTGLTSIPQQAFISCASLTGNLVIPTNIQSVDENAFNGTGITGLTLNEGLVNIKDSAFYNCKKLAGTLSMPKSVISVGNYSFDNVAFPQQDVLISNDCRVAATQQATLHFIYQYDHSAKLENSSWNTGDTFWRNGFQYQIIGSGSSRSLKLINAAKAADFEKMADNNDNGLVSCLDNAVKGRISLPLTVIDCTLGNNYTYNKTPTKIIIPNSVTTIGNNVFKNFSGNLTELKLPEGLTSIGSYAFYGVQANCELELPSTLKNIGSYCFSRATFNGQLNLPDSIMSIPDSAFSYGKYTGLKLPKNLSTIGPSAFSSIPTMKGKLSIPGSCTQVSNQAFNNSGFDSIELNNGLVTIGEFAFNSCTFSGTVTIPGSVRNVGDNAFQSCQNLQGVTFANGLTTIGRRMFADCTNLTGTISVPNSVRYIGEQVFSGDLKLKDQDVLVASGTTVDPNNISRVHFVYSISGENRETVYHDNSVYNVGDTFVKNGMKYEVMTNPKNSNQRGLRIIEFTDPSKVTLSNFADNNSTGMVSYRDANKGRISLPLLELGSPTIEASPNYMSQNMRFSNGGTLQFYMPDTVINMYGGCFYHIENALSTFHLSTRLEYIGQSAFCDNNVAVELVLPASLTMIKTRALRMNSFTYITTPASTKGLTIEKDAFLFCNNLQKDYYWYRVYFKKLEDQSNSKIHIL